MIFDSSSNNSVIEPENFKDQLIELKGQYRKYIYQRREFLNYYLPVLFAAGGFVSFAILLVKILTDGY